MRSMGLRALTLAALALLGACSSLGVVSPQRQEVSLAQDDITKCRAASRTAAAQADCSAKFGPALAKLARDNFERAGRAQDRATRINLYALAANAGWDSGVDAGLQVADAAIQAGSGECDAVPVTEFKPARDCALLRVGPGFVAHVRTTDVVNRLEAKPASSVMARDKRQLTDLSTKYVRNTFEFVEDQRRQFDVESNLDASMITMLDRQRAVFYCTALHISSVNRRLGQVDTARRVSQDRDRMLTAVPALQGETCASIS